MARYKHYDLNQTKMIPLSYADQIVEGSFEHALYEIVEEHLDLTEFEHRDRNDATGRSAYDPRVLLKVVLYRGIVSSRRLAEACRRNIVFMALSADSRPHFTTIAAFVSNLEHEITSLFGDVRQPGHPHCHTQNNPQGTFTRTTPAVHPANSTRVHPSNACRHLCCPRRLSRM